MNTSYILNHLGEERENYFNAVSPPIIQSSNFCFKNVAKMREGLKNELTQPFYTRGYNPTVAILRKKVAALEGAEDALIFSSGSAAVAAAVMSVLKSGDHAVCVQKPYSWTNNLLTSYLPKYGVEYTMVDGTETSNISNALKPNTKLIFLESPNSMTFEMQDIEAVCKIAKEKNIITIIDNSYSSPLNQSPIQLGIDIVVHSATKYMGGHSDVVAGAVCSSKKIIDKLFAVEYMTIGSIISPHDAWLLLRGLRTMELRVNRSSESALKVLAFLEKHPKVEKVLYPFAKSNPQLALAKKQMKQGSGLISIQLKATDIKQVDVFCDNLKYFLLACSWGGYESLAFPVCALFDSVSFNKTPLPWNLVRIYIGIEDVDVLIADLEQALGKV
ncbi:MAG: PLP-dependent transferase [Bacteroidetes bacterium]|nr:PLP-dependent transferase [Bacteroidota bacterium]